MSFHTFPEKDIISFDFFTCAKIPPVVSLDIIKKEIEHKRIVKKEFNRRQLSVFMMIFIAHQVIKKSYVVNNVL